MFIRIFLDVHQAEMVLQNANVLLQIYFVNNMFLCPFGYAVNERKHCLRLDMHLLIYVPFKQLSFLFIISYLISINRIQTLFFFYLV